jgi:hypothetical protein
LGVSAVVITQAVGFGVVPEPAAGFLTHERGSIDKADSVDTKAKDKIFMVYNMLSR